MDMKTKLELLGCLFLFLVYIIDSMQITIRIKWFDNMNEDVKQVFKFLWYILISTVYIFLTVESTMSGFISFHMHREQYTVQKVEIIENKYRGLRRPNKGKFIYVVDGVELEGAVDLNTWEKKGDKIEIAVDKNGDYIRTAIIADLSILVSLLLAVINIYGIYAIICICIKSFKGSET